MAKGRKALSPSRDADLDAMKKRLSHASNAISSTPISPSSTTALTPPPTEQKKDLPTQKSNETKKQSSSGQAKKKHTKSLAKPIPTGRSVDSSPNLKLDGHIRVSDEFDARVKEYALSQNISADRVITALVKEAKKLLTTEQVLSLPKVSNHAASNFDTAPSLSWKRYNYSVSTEVVERCFKLCGDTFKQSPAIAYSAAISAAVVHAFKTISSRSP